MANNNLRRKRTFFNSSIKKIMLDFPDLKYDGVRVICLVCDIELLCWKRQMYDGHINSAFHQHKKSCSKPYAEFLFNLVFMLNACNLPFTIAEKQPFRQFWGKYNPHSKLPDRTTLQKYLRRMRERIENNIISQTNNTKLWLAVDESTDSKRNSIVNIIIRTMNPLELSPPYLVASKRMQECTDEKIKMLVLETLQKFQISTKQVLIFVTDSGSSMIHVGHLLKNDCPNLIHVTCLLHALNLVADTIRKSYPDVDALIVQTKAVFCKSPKRIRKFQEECPNIPQPAEPDLTRWGTWLQTAFYYCKHFQKIKLVVSKFDAKEAASIQESQVKFKDTQIEADLQIIYKNYQIVVNTIEKLKNSSLSLRESLQIIDELQIVLQSLNDENSIHVTEKWNSLLRENIGFTKLRQIYNNSVLTDPLCSSTDYFTYANVTLSDGELSFSLCKNSFSSLKKTTVETYTMMKMFNRAHPNF